jgi:hypothetical protein
MIGKPQDTYFTELIDRRNNSKNFLLSRKSFYIIVPIFATRQCECMYKNIDAPMLTCVWQELEYHMDVWHVTHGAHIEHL